MNDEDENAYQISVGNSKGKSHLEDFDIDEIVTLK
jgi:hypothetical protein